MTVCCCNLLPFPPCPAVHQVLLTVCLRRATRDSRQLPSLLRVAIAGTGPWRGPLYPKISHACSWISIPDIPCRRSDLRVLAAHQVTLVQGNLRPPHPRVLSPSLWATIYSTESPVLVRPPPHPGVILCGAHLVPGLPHSDLTRVEARVALTAPGPALRTAAAHVPACLSALLFITKASV
jgi:hypothetical protein